MDTISRENNTSILPIAGLIAGVVAALLGVVALVQVSKVKKGLEAAEAKVTTAETSAQTASETAQAAKNTADRAGAGLQSLVSQMQGGFNQLSDTITKLGDRVVKLETTPARAVGPAKGGTKEPGAKDGAAATNGGGTQADGSYVVKSGDYPVKIAKSLGVTTEALMAANPGLNAKSLKVGQKLNVPKR